MIAFSRPGSDLLSRVLRRSTIGAGAFHGRVRNGNGCSHPAITTRSTKGNDGYGLKGGRSVIRHPFGGLWGSQRLSCKRMTVVFEKLVAAFAAFCLKVLNTSGCLPSGLSKSKTSQGQRPSRPVARPVRSAAIVRSRTAREDKTDGLFHEPTKALAFAAR